MNSFLSILFILTIVSANAQNSNTVVDVNELFDLKVDSIEQKITINKWDADTSYYLHFKVENISNDTLTYITNTCFYYNHSSLTIDNLELDLNPDGGCSFNSLNVYKLDPGESFVESEWITASNLNTLKIGEWNITLSVPLIRDNPTTYRIDGRSFVEDKKYLTNNCLTKVVKTVVENRKRKKKKKHITHR
tara:strand:- start:32 stop:604 length:573 start_codon:yes stop_codon:yes gene_type:complete